MFAYIITCRANNKSYIGITVDPKRRFSDHARAKSLIGNAIRKHGKENFELKVLVEGNDKYISDLEPLLIDKFGTIHPFGYNLSKQTQESFCHHEESKLKMRKPKSSTARENMSKAKKGKPNGRKGSWSHTDETKRKISNKLTGVEKSEEFKNKLSGRKLAPETKEKISRSNTGKKQMLVTCPHCGKIGGDRTMLRWHFDRCKFKENKDD